MELAVPMSAARRKLSLSAPYQMLGRNEAGPPGLSRTSPQGAAVWAKEMRELQLWGGHECTVNRVGDNYYDQTRRSGHQDRLSDLDRFAELGVKALRYPVLWERIAPERPDTFDWAWTDERLGRIEDLGISPIAGLLHHGSGPSYTNLLDPGFAPGLASFARAVAQRYPHVRDWTPVNEPLTTARFSALYGFWYPHLTDEGAFWTALLNEIDGVRLAMAEIRKVNSAARLIQTEDLGHTYATAAVSHQAEFDNNRRWMTWDLLGGRVVKDHPMWRRLVRFGLEDRLRRIADAPCPPDVLGVNHYLTSDRFLDHRLEAYPAWTHGGNGRKRFADVEAIRVLTPAPGGLEGALEEAWARYGRTMAVTESHTGCTREEQLRWLVEAWDVARTLRTNGVDIEAVTAWALLGSYDWNSLLTQPTGHYECGAFDVRNGTLRPTAVATTLRALTDPAVETPPAAAGAGWWRRDIRLIHAPARAATRSHEPRRIWRAPANPSRPLLITGGSGTLGRALARACEWRGIEYVLTSRSMLSLDDGPGIERALDLYAPWAVINAAGWVRVDDAEREAAACFAANAAGAVRLARACHGRGLPFVGFSSDLVFDGERVGPYAESAPVNPLNVYGASKVEAEREILGMGGRALMVRTAAFFSGSDPHNFAAHLVSSLAEGRAFAAANDLVVSPTYVPDLTEAVLDLLIDGETGLWHLANQGDVTWFEFGQQIAEACGFGRTAIEPRAWRSFGWAAPRPASAPLTSERGLILPSLEHAIDRYAAVMRSELPARSAQQRRSANASDSESLTAAAAF